MAEYSISLILIVYNTGSLIESCLQSIQKQTFQDFELVVINNHSEEDTTSRLHDGLKCFGDRVHYIENSDNVGGAVAGNQGIQAAKGQYVFLMDSDDELPADALQTLYEKASDTQGDVIIGRGASILGKWYCPNKFLYDWMVWAKDLEIQSIEEAPYLVMAPFYWGRLYRRQFLLDYDILMKPGRLNADRYFNSKALLFSKKIVVTKQTTYYWRRYNEKSKNSVTQQMNTVHHFLDRLQGTIEVDALYQQNTSPKTYYYVRMSGILRLLLPMEQSVTDISFQQEYFVRMQQYLADVPVEEIENCPFFTSKKKVLLYLLQQGRFDDVCGVLKKEISSKRSTKNGNYYYQYNGLGDIPKGLCFQPLHRIVSCCGKMQAVEKHAYCFSAEIKYEHADFALLNIWLTDQYGQELFPVSFDYQESNKKLKITFYQTDLHNLKNNQLYYFTLEYWMNGIVERSPCYGDTTRFILTLKAAEVRKFWRRKTVLTVNGNQFQLRKRQGDNPLLFA